MSLESFRAELLRQGQAADTDTMAQPNRYCWLESASNWYKVTVRQPSLIVSTGTTGTVVYAFGPTMPIDQDRTNLETYPMRNGFGFFFAPGDWWVNIQLAGSVAVPQCFVVKSIRENEAAELMGLLGNAVTDPVDLEKWAGIQLGAVGAVGNQTGNEQTIGGLVRAQLVALDASLAATNQSQAVAARGSTGTQLGTLERLLVDSALRTWDTIGGSWTIIGGAPIESNIDALLQYEARRSGYYASRQGRRYTVKSTGITGVAAGTALTVTAPTFLLVAGATNELIIRRIIVSLPLIGTSTTFRALVKTDTADRFSAGGTTRTPATMNNGNVVATTAARFLEAPTATAEGGGTRDIAARTGQITSGSEIDIEFEDGLILAAGGSLLLYAITATAGATVDYLIEYEDANVQ